MKHFLSLIKLWLFFLLLFTGMQVAMAQVQVTGTVTDAAERIPLIGVNVVVEGTGTGTVTDFDGKYEITVPSADAVLEFSYTGYEKQTVSVAGRSLIEIALQPATSVLDEVVVIGYGSVKKSDLTGAVSTVTADAFEKQPLTRLEDALQGREYLTFS